MLLGVRRSRNSREWVCVGVGIRVDECGCIDVRACVGVYCEKQKEIRIIKSKKREGEGEEEEEEGKGDDDFNDGTINWLNSVYAQQQKWSAISFLKSEINCSVITKFTYT
ncbi:hypothetical protein DINM_003814 [Dirofilaria immitis]|nr:hypothetical protein [Dirofilaria immitis]